MSLLRPFKDEARGCDDDVDEYDNDEVNSVEFTSEEVKLESSLGKSRSNSVVGECAGLT